MRRLLKLLACLMMGARRGMQVDYLDTPLIWLTENDPWTIRNACEGTGIYGQPGAGKSSAVVQHIFRAFCRTPGVGVVAFMAKPGDLETYLQWYEKEGCR